ncbi:aminomethyl-transferring glycine dehydrogenase subunit GcvPB [Gammaproteobacteria bacterium]|nr:aminomethyl-transferring glycine dehydrogenase subunit GcvPB [Gammaproteobacteria bacterium]
MSDLIFKLSKSGRFATSQVTNKKFTNLNISKKLLRQDIPLLPEVSELQVVRHYTKLSQKNYSIDTHFYPLGSCTMKYNPKGVGKLAMLDGFLSHHPLSLDIHSQGYMECAYELQEILTKITGMSATSLTPMAGAQGEFTGVAMIKAYHQANKDFNRTEMLVPDAAHGTNPATAAQCGFTVREIPTDINGNVDIIKLKEAVGPNTAGIMLTNPSTLGVFEQKILEISSIMHEAGGLLYYDGANLNAILGKVKPGDMGFDVMHINLHKTFATPHGGGGPGGGPVAVSKRLKPFLPMPIIIKSNNKYTWLTEKDYPQSIGRLSAFMGNAGIILRAYMYAKLLGKNGMQRVAEFATLNANYLLKKLKDSGFNLAFSNRRASHEFIITLKHEAKKYNISALDVAKRLLDYGFHAPTMYFPLLVPECLLIEPTETESKETLDSFVNALKDILKDMKKNPEFLKKAPHSLALKRLDEVKAARDLHLVYKF